MHAYPNGIGLIILRCRILKDNTLDIVIKDKGVGIADLEKARAEAIASLDKLTTKDEDAIKAITESHEYEMYFA